MIRGRALDFSKKFLPDGLSKVGIAPRLYIKKLVGDVLDRVDLHADFDPRRDYKLTVADNELTAVERNARAGASNPDDIELDLTP